jgi:hypothetical protein
MLQGAILLCALAGELFVRYRLKIRRKTPDEGISEGVPSTATQRAGS